MLSHFRTLFWHISRNPLTGRSRIRAMVRYLRHQISVRLGKQWGITGYVMPFVDRTRILARPDGYFSAVSTFGLPELPEMAFLLHSLRPSDVFLDVGANVGAFTVLASGVIGTRTIAVEPIDSTVQELRVNIVLNGIQDLVIIHQVAVGDRLATVQMESTRGTTNRVVPVGDPHGGLDISLTTLDEIVPQDLENLVIKIDVEGYELPAIKGAARLLHSGVVLALIVELNGQGVRYGFEERALHELLVELGYEPCEYDPVSRLLLARAPYQPSAKRYITDSTIYVKDFEMLSARLREAPQYHIHGVNIKL